MAVHGSPGWRASSVTVLSPQQFHAAVQEALRAAIAAEGDHDREEVLRRLFGILREVPSLGPGRSQPPGLPPMLVETVWSMIESQDAETTANPERLLADLMELVLVYYPEAVPPPPLRGGSGVA